VHIPVMLGCWQEVSRGEAAAGNQGWPCRPKGRRQIGAADSTGPGKQAGGCPPSCTLGSEPSIGAGLAPDLLALKLGGQLFTPSLSFPACGGGVKGQVLDLGS
jgi:hypothetical protein